MSIPCTCSHCGATTDVTDEYAGQSGTCSHCGKTIIAPVSGVKSPFSTVKGRRFPLEIKALLTVPFIIPTVLIVIGFLLLPVGLWVREAARRMHCAGCVKRIDLAFHLYAQVHKCYPPAFITDKDGKPMHSWRVLILPFLDSESESIYSQYRFDEPWNSPHNLTFADKIPFVYRCPTNTGSESSQTSYAMIVGPHAISDGPTARMGREITDGCSNTIMVAECAGAGINWLEPRDLNTEEMTFHIKSDWDESQPRTSDISSCHSEVANVGFCDGSVRCLTTDLDPKTIKAMTTIDGGEEVKWE